ncbi:MAG: hypothetical protein ACE5FI_03265 [Anaerolineales bacterium]
MDPVILKRIQDERQREAWRAADRARQAHPIRWPHVAAGVAVVVAAAALVFLISV